MGTLYKVKCTYSGTTSPTYRDSNGYPIGSISRGTTAWAYDSCTYLGAYYSLSDSPYSNEWIKIKYNDGDYFVCRYQSDAPSGYREYWALVDKNNSVVYSKSSADTQTYDSGGGSGSGGSSGGSTSTVCIVSYTGEIDTSDGSTYTTIPTDTFPSSSIKDKGTSITIESIPQSFEATGDTTTFTIIGHDNINGDNNSQLIGQDTLIRKYIPKNNSWKIYTSDGVSVGTSGATIGPGNIYTIPSTGALEAIQFKATYKETTSRHEYFNNKIGDLHIPTRSSVQKGNYSVSFNLNGGISSTGQPASKEISITANYTFDGWYANRSCTGTRYNDSTRLTTDTTVYANWAESFTGNTVQLPDVSSYTKAGYIATGWYSTREPDVILTDAYTVPGDTDSNITLYVNWEPSNANYTVEYYTKNLNADTYTKHSGQLKSGITESELTISNLIKEITGFEFDYCKINNNDSTYTNESVEIIGDGSLIIKLYYKRIVYNVQVTKGTGITTINGSSSSIYSSSLEYGSSITLTGVATRGYNGIYWTIDDNIVSEDSSYTLENIDQNYEITVTARESTDTLYKVYYYIENIDSSDEYSEYKSENKYGTTGQTLTIEGNLNKSILGFTYHEAYDNPERMGSISNITIKNDGTTKVYLFYTRNSYIVNAQSGTGISGIQGVGISYKYGSTVTLLASVESGYTFDHWVYNGDEYTDPAFSFTIPNHNVSSSSLTATAVRIYKNTIYHLMDGLNDGDGNYDNKKFYNFNVVEDIQREGKSFTIDRSYAAEIPNGFELYNRFEQIISIDLKSSYSIGKSFTQSSTTMTFNMYYKPIKYNITYILDGGKQNSYNPLSYTILYGLELAAPTKSGYTFKGWKVENSSEVTNLNVKDDGTIDGINIGALPKFNQLDGVYSELANRTTGDIILRAIWEMTGVIYINDGIHGYEPYKCYIYDKDAGWEQYIRYRYVDDDTGWVVDCP